MPNYTLHWRHFLQRFLQKVYTIEQLVDDVQKGDSQTVRYITPYMKKSKNLWCATTISTCVHKILSFVIPLEVFPPAAFTHVSDGYTANGPTISLLTISNQLPDCTYIRLKKSMQTIPAIELEIWRTLFLVYQMIESL